MAFKNLAKKMVSKLPGHWQNEFKRLQFSYQIRRDTFFTDEKEFAMLDQWVSEGDWVLDIGANIGHYAARLSELVGQSGRVIAFEPVPATFELLAANMARLPQNNVTLLNIAASDSTGIVGMSIPKFDSGLNNFYMAHLTDSATDLQIMTAAIDALQFPGKIKLAKIDAEGHEIPVLSGMRDLLDRDHPVLIVEDNSEELIGFLHGLGYRHKKIKSSSNTIFEWHDDS